MIDKVAIRDKMRTLRRAVKPKRREEVSHAICERLLLKVGDAKLVCCYEAMGSEIDLSEFIAKCPCEVVFPERIGAQDWRVERADEVDMWVCPGLAFTLAGDRCGFGGGWYDRFLASAKPGARKYGVAYRFQIVEELPREAHDVLLDEIVVEGISLDFEKSIGDPVMGIDEAGRGPLVGGVYAAAVSAPIALAEKLLRGEWSAINDSKQLTEKKREELAEIIKATPGCTWAVASASAAEIDKLNILGATHLAMRRASEEVRGKRLEIRDKRLDVDDVNCRILVDGLPVKSLEGSRNVIKGDAKSLFIAAASILAKTARDADCLRLERLYPGYGIAKHKGYPTPEHMAALARLGPCAEHRRSFGPVRQTLASRSGYNGELMI